MTPVRMQDYAACKLLHYIDTTVEAMSVAAKDPDEDAVHKMRVSIRRLQQTIRLFKQYLDPKGAERVKGTLRGVMEIAGELRNRDIAIGLVDEEGGDTSELSTQRAECNRKLQQALQAYATPYLSEFWRKEMGLNQTEAAT